MILSFGTRQQGIISLINSALFSIIGITPVTPVVVNPSRLLRITSERSRQTITRRVVMSYAGQDWTPIEPGETDTFSLDFSQRLAATETISSSSWTCSVVPNTPNLDGSPSSRLNGSAAISGTITSQSIYGCVEGTYYLLEATITTSLSRVLKGYSRVMCLAATNPPP